MLHNNFNNIADILNEKIENARRLAVLGVGSTLRADDGAGMYIVGRLIEAFPRENYHGLLFCPCETAPENFSGAVKNFCPDYILVFDAADMGKMPGEIAEIDSSSIGGPTFCPHMLPLRLMLDYLVSETGAKAAIFGIQYQDIEFDRDMTQIVKKSADNIIAALENFIKTREYIFSV